jgi:uncharacterized SAM-binding protein YcdF (DUF218 family)
MKMIWVVTACLVFLALLLSADFLRRSTPAALPANLPDTAIVFTGQFDRVEAGLVLLEREQVETLFISGVNRPAGIRPEGFAEQFVLSPVLHDALAQGRIILAPDATTTLENAIETACWLAQQMQNRSLVLVTHRYHMPRASLALERAVPWKITVVRIAPEQVLPGADRPFVLREVFKFAATWVITLLPSSLWPAEISSDCNA